MAQVRPNNQALTIWLHRIKETNYFIKFFYLRIGVSLYTVIKNTSALITAKSLVGSATTDIHANLTKSLVHIEKLSLIDD